MKNFFLVLFANAGQNGTSDTLTMCWTPTGFSLALNPSRSALRYASNI